MPDEIEFRIIYDGRDETVSRALVAGVPITLGRDSSAGVVVQSKQVSRLHCQFELSAGKVYVRDTNSSSGTFAGDMPIQGPRPVSDGDEISIGPVTIHIRLRSNDTTAHSTPTAAEDIRTVSEGSHPDASYTAAHASSTRLELKGDAVTIGRSSQCDLVLNNLVLSRVHARLRRKPEGWLVEDMGSTNGTFLNGQRLKHPALLTGADVVKMGPYQLRLQGNFLVTRSAERDGIRICVDRLSKQVKVPKPAGVLKLLDEVTLTINPGEFVGLLGPSGCGKSTLMDALNGRRPGTSGEVLYNDDDLYQSFDSYSTGIGYVPQELIFHDSLPVAAALRYTSRLRLSGDVSAAEMEANIDRVLATVGLSERRDTLIRNLSGGQKKRVSVAMELISKPSVLFLDEVTSGLDMAAERDMMRLFRTLADEGVTVVCITHYVESLTQCDKLACLMRGRLVFWGNPSDFKRHFEIDAFADVYDLEKRKTPAQWEAEFRASTYFTTPSEPAARKSGSAGKFPGKGIDVVRFRRQVPVLTRRYVQLLTTDRTMPLILMLLAPAIALLLCMLSASIKFTDVGSATATLLDVADFSQQQMILAFGSILTLMFLSLFGAVQEVVKELRVYHHERSVNLMIVPYMLSKLVPLATIGLIQSLLVAGIIYGVGGFRLGHFAQQAIILFLSSLAGTTLGLAISAWVPEGLGDDASASEAAAGTKAVTLMNAAVIPQMLFSGRLVTLTGASKLISQIFVSAYWAYSAFDLLLGREIPSRFNIPRTTSPGFSICVLMLIVHALCFTLAFFIAMVRKDGPGAFRRLLRSLPRDDRGRIAHQRVLVQVKELLISGKKQP